MQLTTMNFHVSNNCNLLCKHCLYCSGSQHIDEMDLRQIKKIIDDFSNLTKGKGTVNIYGGEPLIRQDIFEIFDYLHKNNLNVGMTTNINVSKEIIEKLADIPMSRITIDLDGASASMHDWLRNKEGHFEQSISALRYFKSKGKYISINAVMHKKNIGEIETLLALCEEIRVDMINFYIFTPIGRGKEYKHILLNPVEWKEAYKKVQDWISSNNPSFGIVWERSYEHESLLPELPKNLCEAIEYDVFDVRCDGNLYFCGLMLAVDGNSFGNLKEASLKELLEKRHEYLIKNKKGCAALGYLESGDINVLIDPREEMGSIVPVCPYDWEILQGTSELKKKFTHINI